MEKTLSILLPTYKRAKCIGEQLSRLSRLPSDVLDRVEIIVSDNCSPDDTQSVVESFKDKLDFQYIRNKENIGPDRNFLQLLHSGTARYEWLLGDDDYLAGENMEELLRLLEGSDYGLVHLTSEAREQGVLCPYASVDDYLSRVGIMITFISANIINRRYLNSVSLDKYIGSFFIQMPLYIACAIHGDRNLYAGLKLIECDDNTQNGGYNIFKVFVENYLGIYRDFLDAGLISASLYRRQTLVSRTFMMQYIFRILIKKERTNWSSEQAWSILSKYFGWWSIRCHVAGYSVKRVLKSCVKRVLGRR